MSELLMLILLAIPGTLVGAAICIISYVIGCVAGYSRGREDASQPPPGHQSDNADYKRGV